jgi:hypothetical protein
VTGLLGSLAERSVGAVQRPWPASSTCGVRHLGRAGDRRRAAAAACDDVDGVGGDRRGGGAADRRRAPDGHRRRRAATRQSPTNTTLGDIGVVAGRWACDSRRFRLRPQSVVATAALNGQQKYPRLNPFRSPPRARGGRRCRRRELGRRVQQHPGSITAVTGLLGSLAERSVSGAATLACELDLRGAAPGPGRRYGAVVEL